MKSTHILVRPFDKITGTRIDIWVAAARDAAAYGLNGVDWSAAFDKEPEVSGTFFPLNIDGRLQALSAQMSIILNRLKVPAGIKLKNLSWSEAPITIYSVTDLNWSTRETVLTGLTGSPKIDASRRRITLDANGIDNFIDRELLTEAFDGSGGVGGEPEVRDKLKPAGWGYCENIEPVFYDNTRNMAMLDGYGNLQTIHWVAEGLNRYTSFQADYATEALLAAALDAGTVKAGQWASCVAAGVIGFGAPPVGIVTATATFGSTLPGAVMKSMAQRAGAVSGEIDGSSFDSLDTATPYPIRYWTASQENAKSMIERICGSVLATPIIDNLGRIAISRMLSGSSIATLDKSGNQKPRVLAHRPANDWTPVARTVVRAARPSVILRREQINFADDFVPRGTFKTTETYRIGHTVFGPDKAEWLYINTTPALGSAAPLPIWPVTSNTWWQNIGPPALWSEMYGRPPLLMGESSTVDEFLLDPSVWTVTGNGLFSNSADGDGWYSSQTAAAVWVNHKFQNATPIDPNATYEVAIDAIEEGAGAGVATHYLGVVCYDAAGTNINGDGFFWHYFKSGDAVFARGQWETYSARIGKGTARPFPSNAVKFGLVAIINYTNTANVCRVRRMKSRRITDQSWASTNPNRWTLGDGKVIRNVGPGPWGSTAVTRAAIKGPQRFSWRWTGADGARMVGLTESASPVNYTDGIWQAYLHDNGDLQIYDGGSPGSMLATPLADRTTCEMEMEYDGLRIRLFKDGVPYGYSKYVGPDKTYYAFIDMGYPGGKGIINAEHIPMNSMAVVGNNTFDSRGNAWIGDNFATGSDNLVFNGAMETAEAWQNGSGSVWYTGTGTPVRGYFALPAGAVRAIYSNNGVPVSIGGAPKLWLAGSAYRNGALGYFQLGVIWYNAANTALSQSEFSIITVGAGVWETFEQELTPPANAVSAIVFAYASGNSADGAISNVRLAKTESGATLGAIVGSNTVDMSGNAWIGENFGTRGGNKVFNGDASFGVEGVKSLSNTSVGAGLGNTIAAAAIGGSSSFLLFKAATGAGSSSQVWRAIPVIPGQKLFFRCKYYGTVATANGMYFRLAYKGQVADPEYIDGHTDMLVDLIGNGPVATTVTTFETEYTIPAGVYWISVNIFNWTAGPINLVVDDIYVGESQIGATRTTFRGNYSAGTAYDPGDVVLWDVGSGGDGKGYGRKAGTGTTTGVAPSDATKWEPFVDRGAVGAGGATGAAGLTVSAAPPAQPIACTFNGTPKAAVPGFQITVFQGASDVTASATYGTPTVVGLSSVSVSSGGAVTTSGMTADEGYILVPVTYGGATVNVRVDYKKVKDGNAAVSGSANIASLTNGGTYASNANFSISLANGQTFSVSANVAYGVVSSTYRPQVKLASVNVTDGGSEVDMSGSEVLGNTVNTPGDIENVSTSGSVTNSTGSTKTYNIRFLSRRSSGAGNSTSVSGSVGGSG